jgi:hypothetical protein
MWICNSHCQDAGMVADHKMREASALESSRVAAVAGSATGPSDRDLERAKCRPRVTERHMSDIVQEHPRSIAGRRAGARAGRRRPLKVDGV